MIFVHGLGSLGGSDLTASVPYVIWMVVAHAKVNGMNRFLQHALLHGIVAGGMNIHFVTCTKLQEQERVRCIHLLKKWYRQMEYTIYSDFL